MEDKDARTYWKISKEQQAKVAQLRVYALGVEVTTNKTQTHKNINAKTQNKKTVNQTRHRWRISTGLISSTQCSTRAWINFTAAHRRFVWA